MNRQVMEYDMQPTEYIAIIPGMDVELEIIIQYPKRRR